MRHGPRNYRTSLHIKPTDINSASNTLRITRRHAKGGLERDVPISPELIRRLRTFWEWHRNPDWLFPALATQTQWSVQLQPVGRGKTALRYLARYIHRSAFHPKRLLGYDPRVG